MNNIRTNLPSFTVYIRETKAIDRVALRFASAFPLEGDIRIDLQTNPENEYGRANARLSISDRSWENSGASPAERYCREVSVIVRHPRYGPSYDQHSDISDRESTFRTRRSTRGARGARGTRGNRGRRGGRGSTHWRIVDPRRIFEEREGFSRQGPLPRIVTNAERGRPTAGDSTSVSELIFDSTNKSSADDLGSAQEDWR